MFQIKYIYIFFFNSPFFSNSTSKSQWAYYGGPVIGESAIKHLHEIGPKVFHIYEVFNEGPWRVSALDVKIRWPYEVANDKPHGKWLLYLEDIPSVQGIF